MGMRALGLTGAHGCRWARVTLATLAGLGLAQVGPRAAADGPPDAPRVDVAGDGSAPHRTVQAAVDAAAPGATLRIGPGTFEGPVVLRRPVTLVGAGAGATRLVADLAFDLDAAKSAQDRGAGVRPTLSLQAEGAVALEDLALSGRAAGQSASYVVHARAGTSVFTRCAIVDSPGNGVLVGSKAQVTLEGCLVSAIAREGVEVQGGRATLRGCDVRDVRHYGIAIGPGSQVTVEGCRISGSLWHGIRYDDASPVIRGNRIVGHARSGIYASGTTQALVEDNLFLDNDLSGISCWFACADTIRRNTFVGGKREAIAVLGASHPTIEGNVIVGHPTGVLGSNASGTSARATFAGPLHLVGNLFWDNRVIATAPAPVGGAPSGGVSEVPWTDLSAQRNMQAAPGFVDAAAGDFTLPEGSPARAAGAGAWAPLPATGPWPPRPEEAAWKQMLAAERPEPPQAIATGPSPYALAKPWIEGLHSLTDAARRAAAVTAIRSALASAEPVQHHAAFLAIQGSGDVTWERAALRDDVLARLASAQGDALVSGFYALFQTGLKGPGFYAPFHPGRAGPDLERLLKALEDPSRALTLSGSHLLFLYTRGRIEGPAAQAVVRLLASTTRGAVTEVCRGLWGARVSPEVEARLLALADPSQRQQYHDVIYFALSTLRAKSPAVVAALARAAEDADGNVSGRAVWGLTHEVSEAARPAAADLLLSVLELRSGGEQREHALRGLAQWGGPAHAERLRALLSNPALDPRLRQGLEEALQRIQNRTRR